MTERERTEGGTYRETVTPDRILEAIKEHPHPVVTADEVSQLLDCSRDAARKKLNQMYVDRKVGRKEVGARAVVWWIDLDSCERCEDEWATETVILTTPMEPVGRFEEAPVINASVHSLCEECNEEWLKVSGISMNQFLASDSGEYANRHETTSDR